MRTPPGIAEPAFAAVVRQFANVVGAANVYTEDADLDLYRDAYSVHWGEREERVASAAVAPANVDEVRQIARIANDNRIPLYPISTGRNLGYGGSAPAYSGSVVLDLKRMNRILEVNEELHYAIVEPGVSFFDLYNHLKERNIRLYPSPPAPGWGSPIGNALDHGIGNPAGDNFANHCGMEVVLANGDVVRTGMGALPDSKAWPVFHYGYGPYIDGMFSQSNFGIVTKMGFNLFKEPELVRSINVSSRNYDDLDALVSLSNDLTARGVGKNAAALFSPLMSSQDLVPDDPDVIALHQKQGGGTAAEWNALAAQKNRDVYAMGFQFAGPARMVDAQIEIVREVFSTQMRGLRITDGRVMRGPVDESRVDEPLKNTYGIPTMWRFLPDLTSKNWTGHVWFSPTMPRTGETIRKAQRVFQEALQPRGLHWGWEPGLTTFPKTATMLYAFNITKNAAENRAAREAFLLLVRVAAENGWSEYRAAPAFMDDIMNVFSFNDHALRRFHETIKDAVDPNGILSAGRYGIWPRHLRNGRPA